MRWISDRVEPLRLGAGAGAAFGAGLFGARAGAAFGIGLRLACSLSHRSILFLVILRFLFRVWEVA